jgi:hypothetical protein
MQGSRQESALAYPAGRPRTGPEPRMFTSMLTRPSASHRDRGVLAATGKEGRSCSGAPEWTHGYAARRACRGRAPGEVGHLEPALEELADGRVRGGPPALVGLVHQLARSAWASRLVRAVPVRLRRLPVSGSRPAWTMTCQALPRCRM